MIAHIKKPEILRPRSILAFRLDIDLPLAAKPIEVIDKISTHERLQRLVYFRQVHALLKSSVAVHVYVELRHAWKKRGGHIGNFRTFARRLHELGDIFGKERNVFASAVLKNESESAGRADALNGRRWEREGNGAWNLRKLLAQIRFDGVVAFFRPGALSPLLKSDPKRRAVGIAGKAQEVEAGHCCAVFDAGGAQCNLFHLPANGHGSFQGSRERELDTDVKKTLVLFRKKT